MKNFKDVFKNKPEQWGLRGDPHLWDDMALCFKATPFPPSFTSAASMLEAAFEQLTLRSVMAKEQFHIKKYTHGGMSSGNIDPKFWVETGIPLLLSNFAKLVSQEPVPAPVAERPSEKTLDKALDHALKTNPEFIQWLVKQTKFADEKLTYLWSRSDSPWGRFSVEIVNEQTGEPETVVRESETDVLVVLQSDTGKRIALHIENKLQFGSFTKYQAEMYSVRAKAWLGNPKYQSYSDWDTVLIAHTEFIGRNKVGAEKFGCVLRHDQVAPFISEFSYSCA